MKQGVLKHALGGKQIIITFLKLFVDIGVLPRNNLDARFNDMRV